MMTRQKRQTLARRLLVFSLILLGLSLFLTACSSEIEEKKPADYGSYGQRFALDLARSFPLRSPGSEQEKKAGDLIIAALQAEGLQVEVNQFYHQAEDGKVISSRNISVLIPGSGFIRQSEAGPGEIFRRQVIIGTHYDTYFSTEDLLELQAAAAETAEETEPTVTKAASAGIIQEPTLAQYDGIHDNASGVGTLLTIARQLKEYQFGYDVYLVAFGAGQAGQAGARSFASKLTKEQIKATDAMYCIEAIYAGDKVYAHAGRNSVRPYYRKSYELRRKLYEVTDVFYENELYTKNAYMLYTNQANYDVELAGVSTPVLYREWTLNDSDYLPFDDLGIPIVFFESFDYDVKDLADAKESKNPAFTSSNGAIRQTVFDSSLFLNQLMNQKKANSEAVAGGDHLTRRINNTAFVILEAVAKGVHDAEVYIEQANDEPEATG